MRSNKTITLTALISLHSGCNINLQFLIFDSITKQLNLLCDIRFYSNQRICCNQCENFSCRRSIYCLHDIHRCRHHPEKDTKEYEAFSNSFELFSSRTNIFNQQLKNPYLSGRINFHLWFEPSFTFVPFTYLKCNNVDENHSMIMSNNSSSHDIIIEKDFIIAYMQIIMIV